jgi:hypothetical protein
VKANGLFGALGRTPVRGGEIGWTQAYERRMRRFNLEAILAALIALAILTVLLFAAWGTFQNSVPLVRPMSAFYSPSSENPEPSAFETPPKVSVRPYGERIDTLAASSRRRSPNRQLSKLLSLTSGLRLRVGFPSHDFFYRKPLLQTQLLSAQTKATHREWRDAGKFQICLARIEVANCSSHLRIESLHGGGDCLIFRTAAF